MLLHRYKADESYLVAKDLGPAESYLNIERIIDVAKRAVWMQFILVMAS